MWGEFEFIKIKRLEEINLHGLGASIRKTIDIALKIQDQNPNHIQLSIKTETVSLVDDLISSEVFFSHPFFCFAFAFLIKNKKEST